MCQLMQALTRTVLPEPLPEINWLWQNSFQLGIAIIRPVPYLVILRPETPKMEALSGYL
jgi:hypothetical protein